MLTLVLVYFFWNEFIFIVNGVKLCQCDGRFFSFTEFIIEIRVILDDKCEWSNLRIPLPISSFQGCHTEKNKKNANSHIYKEMGADCECHYQITERACAVI